MQTSTISTPSSYPSDKLRSDSLNLLRFPLAVVVLTIHVFAYTDIIGVHGTTYELTAFPLFNAVLHLIGGFLRGQSVPIYFFISGYVFFAGIMLTRDVYKRKLRNRFKTLFVPFVVWNLLALIEEMLNYYRLPVPSLSQRSTDYSFCAFLYTFWDSSRGIFPSLLPTPATSPIYPQDYPLWFVRELIIVVLCTPFISYLLKHTRYYFLCLLGISWFILGHWEIGHLKQLLTAFFFFSWGAYMSINKKDMLVEFGKYTRLSTILYVLLAILYVIVSYCLPEIAPTLKQLNIIVGLFFAYNLASWLLKRGICHPNSFLASSAFFIYVAHALIWGHIRNLFYKFTFSPSSLYLLAVHLISILTTLAILLALFAFMQRYMPALLRIITGRK